MKIKGAKSAIAHLTNAHLSRADSVPSAKRDKRNTKYSRKHTAHNSRKTSGGKLMKP